MAAAKAPVGGLGLTAQGLGLYPQLLSSLYPSPKSRHTGVLWEPLRAQCALTFTHTHTEWDVNRPRKRKTSLGPLSDFLGKVRLSHPKIHRVKKGRLIGHVIPKKRQISRQAKGPLTGTYLGKAHLPDSPDSHRQVRLMRLLPKPMPAPLPGPT